MKRTPKEVKKPDAGRKARCSECGKEADAGELVFVRGRNACERCIHGNAEPFCVYPIGYVRNGLEKDGRSFGVKGDRDSVSRIELFPLQKAFMHRLDEEKRLTVVYYLHKAGMPKEKFSRGLDGKVVGAFASRTPDRLSRIAVTEVGLVKVSGTTIFVKGLDAINGSPVLDIKLGCSLVRKH